MNSQTHSTYAPWAFVPLPSQASAVIPMLLCYWCWFLLCALGVKNRFSYNVAIRVELRKSTEHLGAFLFLPSTCHAYIYLGTYASLENRSSVVWQIVLVSFILFQPYAFLHNNLSLWSNLLIRVCRYSCTMCRHFIFCLETYHSKDIFLPFVMLTVLREPESVRQQSEDGARWDWMTGSLKSPP